MKPTRVEPYNATEILLCWKSGEAYSIPYVELRFQCPCAKCVDELTGKRTLKRESISANIKPTEVTPIGNYALQISWSDGHTTGFYSYETLWTTCAEIGRLIQDTASPAHSNEHKSHSCKGKGVGCGHSSGGCQGHGKGGEHS